MSGDPIDIDQLFHMVRNLPASEQVKMLDNLPDQVRQEVQALMKNDASAEKHGFMDTEKTVIGHEILDSHGTPRFLEKVGDYEIIERLGEGGMGTVYLAQQTQPLSRRVAIKLIQSGSNSSEVMDRFEAEKNAIAALSHPNIAEIFDAGVDSSGCPYFAMEYLQGETFSKYSDEKKLSVTERLELLLQICAAVQHAHRKGIIHRDLKPANIIVAEYDGEIVAKVIDFGLATALNGRTDVIQGLVVDKNIAGTWSYMSPEQAVGDHISVDEQTDVFALGVILFEVLTGERPFKASDMRAAGQAASQGSTKKASLQLIPAIKLPSEALSHSLKRANTATNRRVDPQKLISTLKGELDAIVKKALCKNKDGRYASVIDLKCDIELFLSSRPISALPQSWKYRTKKLWVRNRLRAFAILAVVLSVLLTGTISVWSGAEVIDAKRSEWKADAALKAQSTETETQRQIAARRQVDLMESQEAEKAARYRTLFEAANREVTSLQAGWSRSAKQFAAEAEQLGRHTTESRINARSLNLAINERYDISAPIWAFDQKGIREIAFHPSAEILYAAMRRAYLPDPNCHVYALNAETGEQIADLALLESIFPAANGVSSLEVSEDGTRLFIAIGGTVLLRDTANILRDDLEVKRLSTGLRKITQLIEFSSSGELALFGLNSQDDYVVESFSMRTGKEVSKSVLGVSNGNSVYKLSELNYLQAGSGSSCIRDAVTHEVSASVPTLTAEGTTHACNTRSVAVMGRDDLWVYSLPFDQRVASASPPPEGFPKLADGRVWFSRAGKLLFLANLDTRNLHIYRTQDLRHELTVPLDGSKYKFMDLDTSHDSSLLGLSMGNQVVAYRIIQPGIITSPPFPGVIQSLGVGSTMATASVFLTAPHGPEVAALISVDLNLSGVSPIRKEVTILDPPLLTPSLVAVSDEQVFAIAGYSAAHRRSGYLTSDKAPQSRLGRLFQEPSVLAPLDNGDVLIADVSGLHTVGGQTHFALQTWDFPFASVLGNSESFLTSSSVKNSIWLSTDNGNLVMFPKSGKLKPKEKIRVSSSPVRAIDVDQGEERLVSGDDQGQICIVDLGSNEIVHKLRSAHDGPVLAVSWLDREHFATGGKDGVLRVWKKQASNLSESVSIKFPQPIRQLVLPKDLDALLLLRQGVSAFGMIPIDLLVHEAPIAEYNLQKEGNIEL